MTRWAALGRPAVTAVAASACLALTACTATAPERTDAPISAPASPGVATPSPGAVAADIPPERWAAVRLQSVASLVRARLSAAERDDTRAWLAPLGGPSQAALRRAQGAVLQRMDAIGVEDLELADLRETTAPVPAPPGTSVEWDVRVSLSYRIRDFDTAPRAFDLDLTFKADPVRPQQLGITASAPSGRPQPWDLDGL
ncbi:MAG: hypothetical protein HOQ13_00130, partial [Dermatophilaceae bacterium]|nr:hypothetical protein [Dermatophilaceae bacterium]